MDKTLQFIQADIVYTTAVTCMHLRNKAYTNKADEETALRSLSFLTMLNDELKLITSHYERVTKAIQCEINGSYWGDFDDAFGTVEEYILYYFEHADCPLGTASAMLKEWFACYPDRQKIGRNYINEKLPRRMTAYKTAEGKKKLRPSTDAEVFAANTESALRDIEISNALDSFNERMQQAHQMIKEKAALSDVLKVLQNQ